jgi:hypothetical protein
MPQPDLPHADYRGQSLAVGDTIAFITDGPNGPVLVTGRIALIHGEQLCVESGQLITLKGVPVGGTVYRTGGLPMNPDSIRHATVHRIADTEEQQ